MDSFMNLAKKGISSYTSHSDVSGTGGDSTHSGQPEHETDVSKTGGAEYNSPHHSGQDGSRKGSDSPDYGIDHKKAIQDAKEHGSGDSDLFSSALNFLGANKGNHTDPINDEEVVRAHKKVYENKDTSGLSAQSIGSAAALQVLKQFTSGSSSSSQPKKESGNFQTKMIGMAMAEATKMFDKTGGKGDKQDAVNGAAMTAMKLMVQSKLGGSPAVGGSNSGGLGGLLSLANKFT